jgi:hypothetical protein
VKAEDFYSCGEHPCFESMSEPLTYLACPYQHNNPEIIELRVTLATRAARHLIKHRGLNVFSPLTHSHPLAKLGLSGTWEFWKKIDTEYLQCSNRMVVLTLPGWESSVGVTEECRIAKQLGLQIEYMNPSLVASQDELDLLRQQQVKQDFEKIPDNTEDSLPEYTLSGKSTLGFPASRPVHPDYKEATFDGSIDDTNPKDLQGSKKVPLGLLPAAGKIYGALAMKDGAEKYTPYNWRSKKVRYTIYLDAIERHLLALRDGENTAADSKVHHLGHLIACASLLADAIEGGFIIDDRPVAGPAAAILEKYKK